MNWEFFIGQLIAIVIALITAAWVIANKLGNDFKDLRDEFKKDVEKYHKIAADEIEKCQKSTHDAKGLIFSKLDHHRLETERLYVRQDVNNEKLGNLEIKMTERLTSSIALLKSDINHQTEAVTKMSEQFEKFLNKG